MNLKASFLAITALFLALSVNSAQAQGFRTYQNATSVNQRIAQDRAKKIAQAQANAAYQASFPADWRNGLPPTRLDSFVKEAKQHAAHIYGDEGTHGLPP